LTRSSLFAVCCSEEIRSILAAGWGGHNRSYGRRNLIPLSSRIAVGQPGCPVVDLAGVCGEFLGCVECQRAVPFEAAGSKIVVDGDHNVSELWCRSSGSLRSTAIGHVA